MAGAAVVIIQSSTTTTRPTSYLVALLTPAASTRALMSDLISRAKFPLSVSSEFFERLGWKEVSAKCL